MISLLKKSFFGGSKGVFFSHSSAHDIVRAFGDGKDEDVSVAWCKKPGNSNRKKVQR